MATRSPIRVCGTSRSDGDDPPGQLVAQDQRAVDHEVADPAVPEVVGVGSAHTDGRDLDQDLILGEARSGDVFDSELALAGQDAGPHGGRNGAGHEREPFGDGSVSVTGLTSGLAA